MLGDWYTDLLFIGRQRLVLAVSQPSLLSLLVPARDLKNLAAHIRSSLQVLLFSLHIPADTVEAELHEMEQVAYAPTASRVVLGCMLDLGFQARVRLASRRPSTLNQVALELSTTILSPLGPRHPRDVALGLLSQPRTVVH